MVVIPAHAKVNLALEVAGRRPDGFHDLASVIVTVDWHDLVHVEVAPRARADPAAAVTLRLSGAGRTTAPLGADNLAVRAADGLLRLADSPSLGVDLVLDKVLPAAAGLGGGSSDAAAVLRGGATLLAGAGHPVAAVALAQLAAELGSDVPAAMIGGCLLVTGRGERLRRLPTPALHLAIAVAGASSTAATYAALDEREWEPGCGRVRALTAALAAGGRIEQRLLGSGLEAAAVRAAPELAARLADLRGAVGEAEWFLTGSGGAAFAVGADAVAARALANAARAAGFPAHACRSVGPVLAG